MCAYIDTHACRITVQYTIQRTCIGRTVQYDVSSHGSYVRTIAENALFASLYTVYSAVCVGDSYVCVCVCVFSNSVTCEVFM